MRNRYTAVHGTSNIGDSEKVREIMGYTSSRYGAGGVVRLLAIAATLSAAIVMGFNEQTISIFGVAVEAKYYYSPAFTFFVVANGVGALYGLLSLTFCFCCKAKASKFHGSKLLFFFDFVMTLLVISGASAATAIAYVGKKGNSHSGWVPICDQFGKFCDHVAGALLASFLGTLMFMIVTIMSAGSQ